MKVQLTVDRFAGKKKGVAVLVGDDDRSVDFPRDLLPEGTRAGDVLALTIERDLVATRRIATETASIQEELKERDPGGDISL